MALEMTLHNPWLVAVWPGIGHVATSAGYYLAARLGMHVLAEFSAPQLFEVEHVEIQHGVIQAGRLPRSRVFIWQDPRGLRDLVVFIGEAQPPTGKYAFCRCLVQFAAELGIERIFTFAAMATQMHPKQPSRVFCAATEESSLAELQQLELQVIDEGQIGGLNGVLLGAAAESGMHGTCLLGEIPHVFAQLPFPKASLAVLEAFATIADLDLDFTELSEQAHEVEEKLEELLVRLEQAIQQTLSGEAEEPLIPEPPDETTISAEDQQRIDGLFEQARQNRSMAYALKQELDRLEVFSDYEDRFLDLFKKPG
jgi:proteasome assembly chaperone (PAC2) family protein